MGSHTHDRRRSEPESVYDITFNVLADILTKGEKDTMRRTTAPTMTAEEFRRKADYFEGDIVQINTGKCAGRVAVIISIGIYATAKGVYGLIYNLKLSDSQGIRATANMFSLVRHADDAEI